MDQFVQSAVVRDGFTIAVEQGSSICLKLSGNADMEMVPVLGPYVRAFHNNIREVGASSVTSVTVDLRELYFMNSSCFNALLMWIASIKSLDPNDLYRVHFLTNPKQQWQHRNLRAMLDFAPTIVDIVDS